MNLKFITLALAVILMIGGTTACAFGGEAPTVEPVAAATAQQPQVVSAEAFVVPLKQADLSFEVGGRVAAIEVEEAKPLPKGQCWPAWTRRRIKPN